MDSGVVARAIEQGIQRGMQQMMEMFQNRQTQGEPTNQSFTSRQLVPFGQNNVKISISNRPSCTLTELPTNIDDAASTSCSTTSEPLANAISSDVNQTTLIGSKQIQSPDPIPKNVHSSEISPTASNAPKFPRKELSVLNDDAIASISETETKDASSNEPNVLKNATKVTQYAGNASIPSTKTIDAPVVEENPVQNASKDDALIELVPVDSDTESSASHKALSIVASLSDTGKELDKSTEEGETFVY